MEIENNDQDFIEEDMNQVDQDYNKGPRKSKKHIINTKTTKQKNKQLEEQTKIIMAQVREKNSKSKVDIDRTERLK